ncbi:sigma-E factor negative regulatory protein [Methylomonas sp. MED-D]|uniref:sigma-E factor negative regulatory protein n=1 Tax=unclassified Methylomonas TaxID=2608980 RepID=UPI0028A491C8|nr:sigma-E factor negative regulatory protein [Methylomonas sp. MV1]MDT4328839.1 sigma-E factor negative regulatory protein [Methylomonas sp. MV1]
MQDQLNEKISQLVDDDLANGEALRLLQRLRHDDELGAKLRHYQIIGEAFRSDECIVLRKDFADRIHSEIRAEPIYLLPRKKPVLNWRKASLAIAASAVLAVVWMASYMNSNQPAKIGGVEMIAQRQIPAGEMHARFKEYLQAHDNSLYVNSEPRQQPYTRVVGYQQE